MAVRASWLERASGTLGRAIYEFRLPFRRAKFGQIQTARGSWFREKGKDYKVPENRLDVYTTAWDYYLEHEFARPIINLQASAIFGKGIQFVGDNAQVEFARNLFGKVDLFQYGIEGGIYGDNFVRIFGEEGEDTSLVLLPPGTMTKEVDNQNVLNVKDYIQYEGDSERREVIEPDEIEHIMFNTVSNSLYGNSDLRHLFYWFDMYDSVTEGADKRRLLSGSPVGKFTGIETRHRAALKKMLTTLSRDVDQKEGLRVSVPPGTQWLLPKGVDYNIVEAGGTFDLEVMLARIMLVVAAASETPLHYLSVGTNINLGTSKEMKWPFVKKIQRRQELYRKGFESILRKVMDRQGYPSEEGVANELLINISFPPIYDYDLDEIEKLIKAIMLVNQEGRLSDETTTNLVCNYFGIDVEKEVERIENEEEEKKEDEETVRDRAAAEIGKAVANGEIDKDKATDMIIKIAGK